jgi:hypothetical protein
VLLGVLAAVTAVGLVAAGVVAGHRLAGSPAAGQRAPDGRFPGDGFPGGPPPDGPPPGAPDGSRDTPTGPPEVAANQLFGDRNTGFVLHGRGWPPGTRITVSHAGRAAPQHPVVDRAGTFNYTVNQAREFFPTGPAPGTYEFVVTGEHRERVTAQVRVND